VCESHVHILIFICHDFVGNPISEHDILGGTEIYKKKLLHIFYKLRQHEKCRSENGANSLEEIASSSSTVVGPSVAWFVKPTTNDTEINGTTSQNIPHPNS
jgi:hypothetical protein